LTEIDVTTRASADLAAVFQQRADEIDAACAGLTEAATAQRPRESTWCIREHLSHLYGDDRDTYGAGIERVLIEGVRELDVVPGITHYSVDRREYPFVALVEAVSGQYRAIADMAAAMDPDQLDQRVRIELLKNTPFGAEPRLGEWLVAIADMHLPGHIEAIRETRTALGA
jgi:hypothetical protein